MTEKKKNSERYCLVLDREQATTLMRAAELYARLGIGQFERISELMLDVTKVDEYCKKRDFANSLLKLASKVIYGVSDQGLQKIEKTPDHYRAWNVYQALRYRIAKHDNPDGNVYGVDCNPPYPWGGYPVPMCSVLKADKVPDEKKNENNVELKDLTAGMIVNVTDTCSLPVVMGNYKIEAISFISRFVSLIHTVDHTHLVINFSDYGEKYRLRKAEESDE